jgi:hypothetical protein
MRGTGRRPDNGETVCHIACRMQVAVLLEIVQVFVGLQRGDLVG